MLNKIADMEKKLSMDHRGMVLNFGVKNIKNLHVATIKPGAMRGNHSHELAEFICVINGKNICELEIKKNNSEKEQKVLIKKDLETYKIEANVHHKVRNIGKSIVYIVCFNE